MTDPEIQKEYEYTCAKMGDLVYRRWLFEQEIEKLCTKLYGLNLRHEALNKQPDPTPKKE